MICCKKNTQNRNQRSAANRSRGNLSVRMYSPDSDVNYSVHIPHTDDDGMDFTALRTQKAASFPLDKHRNGEGVHTFGTTSRPYYQQQQSLNNRTSSGTSCGTGSHTTESTRPIRVPRPCVTATSSTIQSEFQQRISRYRSAQVFGVPRLPNLSPRVPAQRPTRATSSWGDFGSSFNKTQSILSNPPLHWTRRVTFDQASKPYVTAIPLLTSSMSDPANCKCYTWQQHSYTLSDFVVKPICGEDCQRHI